MDTAAHVLLTGAGATLATDLWALARHRLLRIPPPDWGQVGRWLAYMPRGRFRHDSIRAATPVRGERALGWAAHYAIGVGFAAFVPLVAGPGWLADPTAGPALAVGLGTVLAPFLLMQPGMGLGLAASRTPSPAIARLQSLLTHLVFGAGLYLSARVAGILLD